jgi:hypothetical protein
MPGSQRRSDSQSRSQPQQFATRSLSVIPAQRKVPPSNLATKIPARITLLVPNPLDVVRRLDAQR